MLATLLVALVAIIHLAILVLEMFLWEAPAGRRAFNLSADFARQTRVLAANQGLYNGFLAAGLAWGLWLGAPGVQVVIFFLACVLAAGIFGALTASRKILYIQALPALLALLAVLTGGDRSADFTVQELDGERRENGYAIPELQISRKENNE